jgi:hypothetical protein
MVTLVITCILLLFWTVLIWIAASIACWFPISGSRARSRLKKQRNRAMRTALLLGALGVLFVVPLLFHLGVFPVYNW